MGRRSQAFFCFVLATDIFEEGEFGSKSDNNLKYLVMFGHCWGPQVPLAAEQAAAGRFFQRHVFLFQKGVYWSKTDNNR